MQISVVIPTCNRKQRLLSLLQNLNDLSCPVKEVIIVDSGEDRLLPEQRNLFSNLRIQYLSSEKSVCIQRNTGIKQASSPWIFLCDDDIEMLPDYLDVLIEHFNNYPEAGAVSGRWLQKENNEWRSGYPITSARMLLWKYIFQSGIWGEINCNSKNFVIKRIKEYYKKKGNHISKAGWPVNTNFTGDYILCPVYSLGASLIKKEWLINSPYDEVLDAHGIGDNYGVIAGFPEPLVHVVGKTFVYHHHEPTNRLKSSLQYYRRVLALDYFIKIKKVPSNVRRKWLLWSLLGNSGEFLLSGNKMMTRTTLKIIWKIVTTKNQYYKAAQKNQKVVELTP